MKHALLLLSFLVLTTSAKLDERMWLIVIHSGAGEIVEDSIHLSRINYLVGAFSSGGDGESATLTLDQFVTDWPIIFKGMHPKASITSFKQGGEINERVIILMRPKWKNDELVFPIAHDSNLQDETLGETVIFFDGFLPNKNIPLLRNNRTIQ